MTSLETLRLRDVGYQDRGVWRRFHPDLFQDQGSLRELDVRPSTPHLAAPLSFLPLTGLSTYNGQPYTRPAAPPENLDYSSGAVYGGYQARHTVTLTWDAPAGVSGITGYRVLRTEEDIAPLEVTGRAGTETSYYDDLSSYAYEIGQTEGDTTFYVDGRDRDLTFSGHGEVARRRRRLRPLVPLLRSGHHRRRRQLPGQSEGR